MNTLTRHYVKRLTKSPYLKYRAIYRFYYTENHSYACLCDASSVPELGFTKLNDLLHHLYHDRAEELYNIIMSDGFDGIIWDSFRVFKDQDAYFIHWD